MILSSSRIAPDSRATRIMRLTRREQQVANLLLEGCENTDIARQLGIAPRTVKACFNHLYLRFGITSGIKRVKLATFLYRSQLCSQVTSGNATQANSDTPHRSDPLGAQWGCWVSTTVSASKDTAESRTQPFHCFLASPAVPGLMQWSRKT
jgi:DNA-binding CsgD family transcriptional regulator